MTTNTHCNNPDCQTCRDYYANEELTFKTLGESRDQMLHEAKDPPNDSRRLDIPT